MSKRLNKAKAEQCLALIEQKYADCIEPGYGPQLVWDWEKTWDSPNPVLPCGIVWWEGPHAWSIHASQNDVIPADLAFAEAGTEYVLALYPVD